MTIKTIFATTCSCLLVIAGVPDLAEAAAKPSVVERSAEDMAAAVAEEVIEMNTDATFFAPAPAVVSSSSALSLFPQLVRLRELLSAATQTKLPTIKTKTYVDRTLGVSLRYPSTLPVTVAPISNKQFRELQNQLKMYELKSRRSTVPSFTYVMVSGELGSLYWSFFEAGLSVGLREGLSGLSTSTNASLRQFLKTALVAQRSTVSYGGYQLRHEYWSLNGRPMVGVYSGTATTTDGVFIGAAAMYSVIIPSSKDAPYIPNEQTAKDTLVTLLEKSSVDAKKLNKQFGQ